MRQQKHKKGRGKGQNLYRQIKVRCYQEKDYFIYKMFYIKLIVKKKKKKKKTTVKIENNSEKNTKNGRQKYKKKEIMK